jgi:hypothetical protein
MVCLDVFRSGGYKTFLFCKSLFREILSIYGHGIPIVFFLMRSSHPRGLMTTRTTKFISSPIFQRIITMFRELCISVKMRLMALGHPLDEAQRLADAITLRLVLICTLLGYRTVRPDEECWIMYRAVMLRGFGVLPRIRGILPAVAGNAGSSRTLLQI